MKDTIAQERLKELLHYDAETGVFTFLVKRGRIKPGTVAGKLLQGYVRIKVDQIEYAAHRLAWFYVYGTWPTQQIDHINRNPSDNRLANLRCVSGSQNLHNRGLNKNNKSGHSGVSWVKRERRWRALITVKHERKLLGYFRDKEEAAKAVSAVRAAAFQ